MLQFNWNRPPLPCPTSGKYRCVSSVSVDVLAYRFNTGHIHHAKCLETSETGSCSVSGNTEMLVAQWVSSDPGDIYVRHCGGSLSVQIMIAMCRILPIITWLRCFSPASIYSSPASTDLSPASTDSSLLAFLLLEPLPPYNQKHI